MRPKNAPIVLSPQQLRNLQLVELEILLELDRVCKKYAINYFLCGGTLLGAVRHKGFIPWDDDVDVGFLRSDYDRFCAVFPRETDAGRFFLQTWRTDPHYRWNYGKIRRLGTEYIRAGQEHMKYVTGISIDIFPYDYLPADSRLSREIEAHSTINGRICSPNQWELEESFVQSPAMKRLRRQAYQCMLLRKAAWSLCGRYQASSAGMRMLYWLVSLVPGRVYAAAMERVSRRYNDKEKYGGARIRQFGHLPPEEKEPRGGIRAERMETFMEIEFEGRRLQTVRDAHWYLSQIYGDDYLTPPPAKARTGVAPVSKIDFGTALDGSLCGVGEQEI